VPTCKQGAHAASGLDLLVASCETGRAVRGRAPATDRIGALVSRDSRALVPLPSFALNPGLRAFARRDLLFAIGRSPRGRSQGRPSGRSLRPGRKANAIVPESRGFRAEQAVWPQPGRPPQTGQAGQDDSSASRAQPPRTHVAGAMTHPSDHRCGSIASDSQPPPLDIAAVVAYCEQRVPPHALYQVRIEAVIDRHAVTLVERRAPWRPSLGPSGQQARRLACAGV
jgi:hypothetical protein